MRQPTMKTTMAAGMICLLVSGLIFSSPTIADQEEAGKRAAVQYPAANAPATPGNARGDLMFSAPPRGSSAEQASVYQPIVD